MSVESVVTTPRLPTELFGVIGRPNFIPLGRDAELVCGTGLTEHGPRTWQRVRQLGEVLVLRLVDRQPEEKDFIVLGAREDELDKNLFSAPDRQGGLRVINPDRAAHQAWYAKPITDKLAIGLHWARANYDIATTGHQKALIVLEQMRGGNQPLGLQQSQVCTAVTNMATARAEVDLLTSQLNTLAADADADWLNHGGGWPG